MRIALLGPLEVRTDAGRPVQVGGPRLRTLLILLALEAGRVATTQWLIDGVWGEAPPVGAANALQALVSRLRRAVPELPVESHPAGYRLAIPPDQVDVARFERLVGAPPGPPRGGPPPPPPPRG
ncbi:MAG: winged helix-turn-helix domain-containing protein, partial [Micromonosporaceae bacterium]|nr:winged helix-turn-helix domain-containing protein [Micromonosporaceae bacterium]